MALPCDGLPLGTGRLGLIASLIAVAAITAMTTVGTKLSGTFGNVSAKLK